MILRPPRPLVALYLDVEQDLDNRVAPEACRRALLDLLAVARRAGAAVTCHVAGILLERQPELARWIATAGAERAFHSFTHPRTADPATVAAEVARCRAHSPDARGYRSPRGEWSDATLDALVAHGFAWSAEADTHDEPYFIRPGLVRLPLSGDDWLLHERRIDAETWVRRFQVALARRSFVGYGCHDLAAASRPEAVVRAWAEVARLAASCGRPVTMSDAADLFRSGGGPFHRLSPDTPRVLRLLRRLGARLRPEDGRTR